MTNTPKMGPVALCTLIAADGQALADAYTNHLHQNILQREPLARCTADAIGFAQLQGNASWVLANKQGRPWLQIVEHPDAVARDSLRSFGWLALEVLVENVDELADALTDSPFELLRGAADLDVSDKIRACQVRGPAGEILYLTQVSGEVPPFDLPICQAPVDHLFIPVLSTPCREQSLVQYSDISGNVGISFDTKITVVNQARNYALDRRHPVATLQLAGQALIEIDQIDGTFAAAVGIHSGMANVAFYCTGTPPGQTIKPDTGPFIGHTLYAGIGCADERFTLVYS